MELGELVGMTPEIIQKVGARVVGVGPRFSPEANRDGTGREAVGHAEHRLAQAAGLCVSPLRAL